MDCRCGVNFAVVPKGNEERHILHLKYLVVGAHGQVEYWLLHFHVVWIMDIDLCRFRSITSTGLEGSNSVVELALNHH